MYYTPADRRQIDLFIKAAKARLIEKGMAEDRAEQLLADTLVKVSEELGLPSVKKAESRRRIDAYKVKAAAELSKLKL